MGKMAGRPNFVLKIIVNEDGVVFQSVEKPRNFEKGFPDCQTLFVSIWQIGPEPFFGEFSERGFGIIHNIICQV